MDPRALFRQLTCGVNFSATKTNRKRPLPTPPIHPSEIKKEKFEQDLESDDSSEDEHSERAKTISVELKEEDEIKSEEEEIKSENEEKAEGINNLNIFGNIVAPNLIKKKKAKMTVQKQQLLETERINQIRNKHQLHVTGKDPPAPLETFIELQKIYRIPCQLIANLAESGYSVPTPIQMQAIPIMAGGHSLLACAPTGSGKTAAFLLPIIRDLRKPKKKGFRAVILCPTRELAKQTQRECLRLVEEIGLRVHTLSKTNQAEHKYGPKSNKQFDILVTTPNRVCHLLAQSPPLLDFSNVKWLILDEADKLFEEGTKSFRDQFDQIYNACTHESRKVGLFSATWTSPVAKWCRKNLKDLLAVSVGQRNAATELVDQKLLFVGSEAGKLLAFRDLLRTGMQPPVLVFVDSKDRAQQLYKELIYDGINVDVIHSDRTQLERDNVVKAFREGKVWVLICTEIIGRGIDFKGVNLVINYDFPPSAIAYIHRIGRTGRAGRRGQAITYFTQADTVHLKSVAKIMRNSGCEVPEYMLAMKERSNRTKNKIIKAAEKRADIRPLKGKFGKGKKTSVGVKGDKKKISAAGKVSTKFIVKKKTSLMKKNPGQETAKKPKLMAEGKVKRKKE